MTGAAIRRCIPMALVLVVVAAALILVLADRWRRGAFVLGVAVLLAAVCRGALPTSAVGILAVRSRVVDTATMASVGAAIVVLAVSIDPLGTD